MTPVTTNEDGVSVLQTMLVIVIVCVLIVAAVPAWSIFVEQSRTRTCQANQRKIMEAIALARTDGNVSGSASYFDSVLEPGHDWGSVLIPEYLERAPRCPSRGGGLYFMSPLGRIWSDRGPGQYTFLGQGTPDDHRLAQ